MSSAAERNDNNAGQAPLETGNEMASSVPAASFTPPAHAKSKDSEALVKVIEILSRMDAGMLKMKPPKQLSTRTNGYVPPMKAVWWGEFSKLRVELPKHSLRRTADLRGGTPIPRIDLDSPCVPVSWRVALFGRLG